MNDFFDSIGLGFLDPGILILVLFALFIVILILVIADISGRKKLERRLDQLTSGTDGESLEDTMLKIFREYAGLHKVLDRNTQDIDDIYDRLQTVIQKVGIVKYNAFRKMGGQMSSALVLLDENDDGVLINNVQGMDGGGYSYLKIIKDGKADVELSKEEAEALDKALLYGRNNK